MAVKRMERTVLVYGPWDGHVLDNVACCEEDSIVVNQKDRYLGTGEKDEGRWVAVHSNHAITHDLNRVAVAV